MTTWQELYLSAGLSPIPLDPGAKTCRIAGWATCPVPDLWAAAGPGPANVGLRAGDDKLTLDGDSFDTVECLLRWLESLGIFPPGCISRDGQHVYLRSNIPSSFHLAKFAPRGLEGEIRGNHSYTVAAPSEVADWKYRLTGDIRAIPTIEWRDVQWLLPQEKTTVVVETPIPLLRRNLPAKARRLAAALEQTPKGQPVDKYASRSEAIWAFWAIGISAGWTYPQLRRTLGDVAYTDRWLQQDYRRALTKMQTIGNRAKLHTMYEMASGLCQHPDPRRQKMDTDVLRGAISVAWAGAGRDTWTIHVRDVARASGRSPRHTAAALRRLASKGLLQPIIRGGKVKGYALPN